MFDDLLFYTAFLAAFFAIFSLSSKKIMSHWLGFSFFTVCFIVVFVIYVVLLGIEFGLTYGFFAFYISALLLIFYRQNKKTKKNIKPIRSKKEEIPSVWWVKILRFICVGPLAGIIAAFVCVGFCRILPIETIDQLVLAAFLYPLIWMGFAFFCCYAQIKKVHHTELEMAL